MFFPTEQEFLLQSRHDFFFQFGTLLALTIFGKFSLWEFIVLFFRSILKQIQKYTQKHKHFGI